MAREFCLINGTIWNDHDFRSLPAPAQHLYLLLWTDPDLSYCGVADYRPGRIAKRAEGLTSDTVEILTACLEARHFLVVDRESEEVLIRSWMRWDGLMKQPRLAVSMVKAYGGTSSNLIRGVVVSELHKIRRESPDLTCWSNPKVSDVMSQPSRDAKSEVQVSDPFGDGFRYQFGQRLGQPSPDVSGSVSVPPTTSTSTSTSYEDSSSEIADAVPDREDVLELCNLLADLMVENGNKRPVITKAWKTDARLLLDRDNRTLDEAKHLIRWCQGDSFWRSNIMSMSKFRQQYDKLRLRREPAKPEPREEFDWQNRGWGR